MYSRIISILAILVLPRDVVAQDGVDVSGTYRLRYETLQDTFLAGGGNDQVLASRLLIALRAQSGHLSGGGELLDARTWLDDAGTPLGTDDVNSAELLQAWVGLDASPAPGLSLETRAGLLTMDLGSRRLIARNRFRNTLNGFAGITGKITGENFGLEGFYLAPRNRQPADRQSLDANRRATDHPDLSDHMAGLALTLSNTQWYFVRFEEADDRNHATANRRLNNLGLRALTPPALQSWDYEFEAILQWGTSRSGSSPALTHDLDHHAYYVHGQLGYSFRSFWTNRVSIQLDVASGDDNAADGRNTRFDTLFGARRFEYGPTGIYGFAARTNMISPGVRWIINPGSPTDAFLAWRAFWLDAPGDAVFGTGIRQAGPSPGRFAGQQLEARLRLRPVANVTLETGAAWLDLRIADATGPEPLYWYGGFTYSF